MFGRGKIQPLVTHRIPPGMYEGSFVCRNCHVVETIFVPKGFRTEDMTCTRCGFKKQPEPKTPLFKFVVIDVFGNHVEVVAERLLTKEAKALFYRGDSCIACFAAYRSVIRKDEITGQSQ